MPGTMTSRGRAEATLHVRRAAKGVRRPIELVNPVSDHMADYAQENRLLCRRTVQEGAYLGKTVALCGAGPSLGLEFPGVDYVFATNSAATHLMANGVKVDVALAIDQTDGMLRDWRQTYDMAYWVASTVDPALVRHLEAEGREVTYFHNAVGFDGEMEHYREEWPPAFCVGSGATVVPRMIGLLAWLGFRRIDIYGADCAFAEGDVVHANGDTKEDAYGRPLIMQGEIDGRTWRTRPDMLLSAVDLARKVRQYPGRIRLIGDTLPVALCGMEDEFLDTVMRQLRPGESVTPED